MSSWNDRCGVPRMEPGPRDSVVLTLLDGKRFGLTTIDMYENALAQGNALARGTKQAVKVLPLTLSEYINLAEIDLGTLFMTPESEAGMRAIAVATLREAMIEAPDVSDRIMARDTLRSMGDAL